MTEYQNLISLDIFTDKTKLRMNDRSLIEELAAYLFKGITDKRTAVDDLFTASISNNEIDLKFARFCNIIDRIYHVQSIRPINQTRYKQRNDFYTLFAFINNHLNVSDEIWDLQYKTLVYINDEGLITPSNDRYETFKEYAIHCVSQSNSKNARQERLTFFNQLLANDSDRTTEVQDDLIDHVYNKYNLSLPIIKLENYNMLDISKIIGEQ